MIPEHAQAILLLPSGHRAFDEDFAVTFPVPRTIDVAGTDRGVYGLVHIHHSGLVDDMTRALYVLGGHYRPHGVTHRRRLDPDEAHDQ